MRGHLSDDADYALRNFHEVRWLGGEYELPLTESHCAIAVLKFENGKFIGREHEWKWAASAGEPRTIPYLLMWGLGEGGTKLALFAGGTRSVTQKNEFFGQLDGGLSRSYGKSNAGEIRGCRVIGFASSKEARPGREAFATSFGDLDQEIKNKKHVGVLVVKPFSSEEEASHWVYGRSSEVEP